MVNPEFIYLLGVGRYARGRAGARAVSVVMDASAGPDSTPL